jgi:small GTP-binding protein
MIRSLYVLGQQSNVIYSKEYVSSESRQDIVEFLVNLSHFVSTVDLGEKIESMGFSATRIFYTARGEFVFIFVADKSDDASQIEEKMNQLIETFMKDFAALAQANVPLDGFDSKVDEIAVTTVKVAILGYSGVGKTTALHLLRGETLPLVHIPTMAYDIKRLPDEVQSANIVLWDLAGQSGYDKLWSKYLVKAQIVIIVTDSTLENVLRSKRLVSLVKQEVPEARIIGIANKQDLPTALTPERVSQILGIPTYELVAIDISYRDRLIQIIRKAILEEKAQATPASE